MHLHKMHFMAVQFKILISTVPSLARLFCTLLNGECDGGSLLT